MEQERNKSFDFIRLIAAFFVICIHAPCFYKPWIVAVGRFAVPVFFMMSGFLTCGSDSQKVMRQLKKILCITIFATLFYLAVQLIRTLLMGTQDSFFWMMTRPRTWITLVLYNEPPFAAHLWYLYALLYCLVIEVAVTKTNPRVRTAICCLIPVLFFVCLALGNYSVALFGHRNVIQISRNWLFMGVVFFYTGYLMKRYGERISRVLPKELLRALIILFCIGAVVETEIIGQKGLNAIGNCNLSGSFLAIAAMLCALKYPSGGKKGLFSFCALLGQKYSLMIYIIHPFFKDLMDLLIKEAPRVLFSLYQFFAPWVLLCLSLAAAVLFDLVKSAVFRKKQRSIPV